MYAYEWTGENGIFRLTINGKIQKEIRPVFKEELDYFGLNEVWTYPDTEFPLLWAEGIRRYILNGKLVAEAKGGGFYSKPKIKIYDDTLNLDPIDVSKLWSENKDIMSGLERTAVDFIRHTHDEYKEKGYTFAVGFSGGKDSLVLLDLVSRALSPDEFYVVFSNTGMELSCTLNSVEAAKKHWPMLRFYEAKSHLNPLDSWKEFGPPGRRMRWCCSVHKSVPTILKLRELTENYNVQAVVFDGVRAEESAQRATYEEISVGAKNINQINCSPILKWNTAELYLYLLRNNILFNKAYRQGLFRVGCMVCPMSSAWWDGIANDIYKEEMLPLLEKVEKYAELTKPEKERKKFIEQGGWKARMGGRGLPNGGNRVTEVLKDNKISFSFIKTTQDWMNVAPILGPIVEFDGTRGVQIINHQEYEFYISENEKKVVYGPYSNMDRFVISHLRGDHGSSRLAALAFHEKPYTFLPDGATAMAFGRFCKLGSSEVPEGILENMEQCIFDEDTYIVMKDYNHFKQTGNAAGGNNDENAIVGELHGGLTPEESIVPLIVLHRKNKPVQIKIENIDKSIKTKGGKGKIIVTFSQDVHSLNVETFSGKCDEIPTEDPKIWTLCFESITGAELSLQFTVNGRLMSEKKTIKVKTPLGSGMKGGLLP